MTSTVSSRMAGLLGLLLCALALLVPAASVATPATPSGQPTVAPSASPSHTTLPPYEGDTAPPPVRTRQDRIISTIAPIAMVAVLIAGLYIYWLIRKGL